MDIGPRMECMDEGVILTDWFNIVHNSTFQLSFIDLCVFYILQYLQQVDDEITGDVCVSSVKQSN